MSDPAATSISRPSFAELFTPKLVTVLREGYGLAGLRDDALAGMTVAVVALPLSMAIAIASGGTPAQGLYTAIVGGFLVSALGGSRFQIGGPAGAFIVLVAATVQQHGMEGLFTAVLLSGLLLTVLGLLRLGTYIKFIPYPVTVGFTAGIAVIIFASQLRPLLGLALEGDEPGPFLEKLPVLAASLGTFNPWAAGIAAGTILMIVGVKRFRPGWPGMLIAVAVASAAAAAMAAPVATIESAFGGVPRTLPSPSLPDLSWAQIVAVAPNAVGFALLGAIESLLSAVVADGMTGRRHRSNCELAAQGVANCASALFGGLCVTGTIARTATNVRAGARGPVAGMLHALFLLAFMGLAAPLAGYIPLACLAGVLAVVAWNMIEWQALSALFRSSRGDAAVLGCVFLITVLRDLTEAIVVGVALGSVLFLHRLSRMTAVSADRPFVDEDRADGAPDRRQAYDGRTASDPDVVILRITGVFFFGAAGSVGAVLDRIADRHSALVVDLSRTALIDSTAVQTLEMLHRKASRRGVRMILCGVGPEAERALAAQGLAPPAIPFAPDEVAALALARGP
ncbi:SulP family inorganic anion transporter [Marivibrio halodurans]|uniref:SulP family inorganic anion transporter n=1 Tax=Marivibrio halodurans TaxID=2039722 RepID=A0A8J7S502_9PROT|nr:SulP family inorganic anion transporter [Marivibrio halodurans]MBP5858884.1 SulP family inorganic anion transporter [Marivibrio halodurans]